MGKFNGSPPPAPDPTVTSQAQAQANAETARLQAKLNRVNQVGPQGSITYSQGAAPMDREAWINGEVAKERARIDAENARRASFEFGGNSYDPETMEQVQGSNPAAVPLTFDEATFRQGFEGRATPTVPGQDEWTQITTLSPEQQALYDLTTRAQTTYGQTANSVLEGAQATLSQPVQTDWEKYRADALKAQRSRLDPVYAEREEALRQRLINSGYSAGTEGWDREFRNLNQGYNDALLAADLQAGNTVGQGISQTAALRAMPLNEASVLLSGGQVSIPQLQGSPPVNVAPTDVMGAYNTQYQGALANWNAQQQRSNAAMGGLFGLAGTLGGAGIRAWG